MGIIVYVLYVLYLKIEKKEGKTGGEAKAGGECSHEFKGGKGGLRKVRDHAARRAYGRKRGHVAGKSDLWQHEKARCSKSRQAMKDRAGADR